MSTDAKSLFLRIVADPRDLEARREYADAIAERDPEHAAFIRLQLARYRTRGGPSAEERRLAKHSSRWSRASDAISLGVFEGGFVELVRLSAVRYLEVGASLRAVAPILDVQLTDVRTVAQELFASPLLAGLRSLDLRQNRLADEEALLLARCEHLRSLRWLDLSMNRIERLGLEAIAGSAHLEALEWLGFRNNPTPDPTPEVLEEGGFVHAVDRPPLGVELEAKFGRRPWMVYEAASPPPPRLF